MFTAKAYVRHLSEALSVEYEFKGVLIQTVLPNQVKTQMIKNVEVPLIAVSPEHFVSAAIKTVGIEVTTYGHWKHKLMAYLFKILASLMSQRLYLKLSLIPIKKYRNRFYRQNYLNDTHIDSDPNVHPSNTVTSHLQETDINCALLSK